MPTLITPLNLRHSHSQGFTLIEVLVGMAVALIGMVMMFQSMQSWESRKRTTTAGSDAQVSGSIAMFSLERDLKMAGYGFGNAVAMNCTVSAYDSTRAAPGTFNFPMVPVLITNGAAGAPDTITVLYGSGTTMSSSQSFNNLSPLPTVANDGFKRTNTRTGLRSGDLMIAADSGNAICGLFEVTGNANADGLTIDHGTGAYLNFANNQNVTAQSVLAADARARLQAQFLNNSGSARYNDGTAKGVGSMGAIFNLGTFPQLNVWQISNRRFLTVNNGLANQSAATEVAEGIINLQAEYGVDTNGNGVIDAGEGNDDNGNGVIDAGEGHDDNGDGVVTPGEWGAALPGNWRQLRAIRIALLARSQQYEKTAVTTTAPVWAGGAFIMTNVDGTADTTPGNANDWRHYRYRVYEMVIPLRNLVWGMS